MKNKGQSPAVVGQGLIELVVSVGVILLVLAGTLSLVIFSMGKRNKSSDRSKAIRLAGVVMERLVETKRNNPEAFWQLTEVTGGEMDGFDDYLYSIDFSPEDCGENICTKARVSVDWSGAGGEVQFSRFFAK